MAKRAKAPEPPGGDFWPHPRFLGLAPEHGGYQRSRAVVLPIPYEATTSYGAGTRFGPGAKTAVIVAVALWFSGLLINLIGYGMIGLYPMGMLTIWGAQGLVEMIVASLVGGWIYREE